MQSKLKWTSLAARASLMLGAGALLCVVPPTTSASAQESDSAAQKPFIMLLVDTSGSMEWTDEGDEHYPRGATEDDRWALEKPLSTLSPGDAHFYGPCRVWLPSCEDYSRPTWNWSSELSSYRSSTERAAENSMRDPSRRLSSNSQPRHVTLKEILTGDMVLAEPGFEGNLKGLSRLTHGPGCWLVPRQRGAANNGDMCGDYNNSKFNKYPDSTDPLPHFQEVFDTQLPNGLMDTMGSSAIFGLAMLDSYQHSKKLPNDTDAPAKDWNGDDKNYAGKHMDDVMDKPFAGLQEGDGGKSQMYNLGVFQMIVPKSFEMSSSVADHVSSFVQYALIDAGYLNTSSDYELKIGDDNSDAGPVYDGKKIEFSKKLNGILDDYPLGKQPVARATPLAAAIYDIHQFFAHGHKGNGSNEGPVMKDNYRECRPKQVVIITDGKPEPELPGGNVELDDTLNPTFGYNKAQYPYTYTEQAIDFFVNDYNYGRTFNDVTQEASFSATPRNDSYLAGSWTASKSSDAYLKALSYDPRVHIVGVNAQTDPDGQALNTSVIGKMAEMAISGRTCAEYYLNEQWIPTTDPDASGSCDPDKKFCLDIRQAQYMKSHHPTYDYLARNGDIVECRYPALILSVPTNPTDPSLTLAKRTTEGLQLLFNHIVAAGLSSRTRPTYVNQLDDPSPAEIRGGQYRYFSGVNTQPGSVFWKGQLYRQAQLCSNTSGSAPPVLDISEQINSLAGKIELLANGNRHQIRDDYRRIFTSFTSWNPTYFEDPSLTSGTGGFPGTMSNRFALRAGLASNSPADDQFAGTYLTHEPKNLKGSRIPLEFNQLQQVYNKIALDPDITRDVASYFHTQDAAALIELIDEVRGRSEAKDGRAFGAILNASPVAVEPPDQALPIDSYRAFQIQNATRPSMIYSATTDGLLHAIYAGELETTDSDQVILAKTGAAGSMNDQREAWAYLPQMLHTRLASYQGKQPALLDGTPTVKDVRLCHQGSEADEYNVNQEACAYTASGTVTNPAFQWRTVLVAGLGSAGSGYYALDVTRPGGRAFGDTSGAPNEPDPIPLWEFDPEWERFQVERIVDQGRAALVHPTAVGGTLGDLIPGSCQSGSLLAQSDFWNKSFMGISVGEAAIGTIVVDGNFKASGASDAERLRRPIAVFSGGVAEEGLSGCEKARRGRAVYVVDLQTGSLLRRFVSYEDALGIDTPFDKPVSGSPALYDARPGSLVTRGFVGDSAGRLFRMDLSDPDPANWEMKLFFDPSTIDGYSNSTPFGPAAFKPALVKSSSLLNNDLLVFYGLGERGDLSVGGTKQLMIAVREKTEVKMSGTTPTLTVDGEEVWHYEFETTTNSNGNSEKLTSAPVVFNGGVYFTTFVEPGADLCEPGWSRIYGMTFQGDLVPGNDSLPADPKGLFRTSGATDMEPVDVKIPTGTQCVPSGSTRCKAYEPDGAGNLAEAVVVRGLTITLGQTCLPPSYAGDGTTAVQQDGNSRTPTLMAQSTSDSLSGVGATSVGGSAGQGGSDNGIFSIEQSLADPRTQYVPLSWAVIDN